MIRLRWKVGGAALLAAAVAIESPAADFIRGDANGDGRVTLADVAVLNGTLFWGIDPPCWAAIDFNDDSGFGHQDQILLEQFLLGAGGPPAAPYPVAGPDTTGDPGDPGNACESYESTPPLDDAAAAISIGDVVAAGGDDVHAVIRVSIAHSLPIWTFFGAVEIGAGLVEDAEALGKDDAVELFFEHEGIRSPAFTRAQVKDGRLQFGIQVHDSFGLPPREEAEVLAIKVCLRGGVPAGEYPLTLAYGDFSRGAGEGEDENEPDLGRVIFPALTSATLTVLEDVRELSTCRVRPLHGVNVTFTLGDAIGAVGGNVAVPMFVNGDREGHGFGFEISFDSKILEATEIEQVFTRPDDLPFVTDVSEIDNEGGIVRAFFKSSSDNERHFLPPFQDNPVVVLHFRVLASAESTEIRFDADSSYNTYKAFDDNYTPELANSFVLVGSVIQIVPDISLFRRGDSNGDSLVNISDAMATLGFLFLDGRKPHCLDAADANDDGSLDMSDPIFTLDYLFRGVTVALPPPNGEPGTDPTPDGLTCLR
jgi:hypothetical protein